MLKTFALGAFMLDIATTIGSFGGILHQDSFVAWLALNVVLLMTPLAYRFGELLVLAVTDAPEVLTLDVQDTGNRRVQDPRA